MAYNTITRGHPSVNFLESEIGLITKTHQIPASLGVADGKHKVVRAGTLYPANNSTAIGVVFTDVDVTDGDAIGAVMVAGRVLKDRLDAEETAITALAAKGLYFI